LIVVSCIEDNNTVLVLFVYSIVFI
jgi:hypothetical protein